MLNKFKNKRKDSDHDLLSDYEEVNVYGTDPHDPDTDCDGVPDGVEVRMGRNPKGPGLLKDLFIPNECNDFRPKALHPRRLTFHALSAVIIKIVMVVFLLSFPVDAWLTPDVLYEQSNYVVELTNNIRTDLNRNVLTINTTLQQAAIDKAEDMIINQYFAHISPDGTGLRHFLMNNHLDYKVAGENLALGYSSAEEVVDAWTKSPTHYANLIDSDYTEIGVGMLNGNYKGYDTTVVAQFFRQPPKPIIPPVEEIVEEVPIEEEVIIVEEPVIPVAPVEVLAEKEELPEEEVIEEVIEPLLIPVLISPNNNLFTKDNIIDIVISAPQAVEVNVFDNNEIIKTVPIVDNQANINISLVEGEHNLQFQAVRDQESILSAQYTITIDNTIPVVDHEQTYISVAESVDGTGVMIQAVAYLSEDTSEAEVYLAGRVIKLFKEDSQKWTGALALSEADYDELLSPMVLAGILVVDFASNRVVQDINFGSIQAVETSAIEQYGFIKDNASGNIKPIFDFTNIYFQIVIALAVLALLLSIVIHWRRQSIKTVASATAFIILLIALTIF